MLDARPIESLQWHDRWSVVVRRLRPDEPILDDFPVMDSVPCAKGEGPADVARRLRYHQPDETKVRSTYSVSASAMGQDREAELRRTVATLTQGARRVSAAPEVVERTVRECFAEWENARISDFVGLLAERRARELLRKLTG